MVGVRSAAASLLSLSLGCQVGDLDTTGKRCKTSSDCGSNLTCLSGLCAGAATGGPGRFVVRDLHAAWASPHAVRWEWVPDGEPVDFGYYELELRTPADDVLVTRTQADSPELGAYALVDPATGDSLVVRGVVTGELVEGSTYEAVLIAYDRSGQPYRSSPAVERTRDARVRSLEIFEEATPPGIGLPADAFVVADGCGSHGSNRCLRYTLAADPEAEGQSQAFQNLRWQELEMSVTDAVEATFEDAYFDFDARAPATMVAYYCVTWVVVGLLTPTEEEFFRYEGWALPRAAQSGYVHLEFPLHILTSPGGPMRYSDFVRGLWGVNVGCVWSREAAIDGIGVRY